MLPFVEATFPKSPAAVLGAIRRLFNDGLAPGAPNKFPPGDRLAGFSLYPRAVPAGSAAVPLPSDFDLRNNTVADPAMARYLGLPEERRKDDLFLYHPLDLFWPSEDFVGGRPAPFTCHFVIHVEPAAGPAATRVEVLEYLPLVDAGRKLSPSAHGVGIGFVRDLRLVPPTTADRVELLERIRAAVAAG